MKSSDAFVRALAGTIVLSSLSLGYFVHPGWFLLTAFAGANLFQSAFTGFCPAEFVLKRLGFLKGSCGCCCHEKSGSVA